MKSQICSFLDLDMMLLALLLCFLMSTPIIVATGPELFTLSQYITHATETVLPGVTRVYSGVQSLYNGHIFDNMGGIHTFVRAGGKLHFDRFLNRHSAWAHFEGEGNLEFVIAGYIYNSYKAEFYVRSVGNSLLWITFDEINDMTNDGYVLFDSRGSLYIDGPRAFINRGAIMLLAVDQAFYSLNDVVNHGRIQMQLGTTNGRLGIRNKLENTVLFIVIFDSRVEALLDVQGPIHNSGLIDIRGSSAPVMIDHQSTLFNHGVIRLMHSVYTHRASVQGAGCIFLARSSIVFESLNRFSRRQSVILMDPSSCIVLKGLGIILPVIELFWIYKGHSFFRSKIDISTYDYDGERGTLRIYLASSQSVILVIGCGFLSSDFRIVLNEMTYIGDPPARRPLPAICKTW